jgi:Insertion element 4 transposase N-terminal
MNLREQPPGTPEEPIPIPFNSSCQQRKPPASMSLPQLYSWQGGYGDRYRQGSQRVRVLAHSRASPRSETYHPSRTGEEILARTGQDRSFCSRLPRWFMVWFVMALGLFCCDCYRQVFRWLQPFRRGRTLGRSTFCEARKRLGIAPPRFLANQVIACRAEWSQRLVRLVRRHEA